MILAFVAAAAGALVGAAGVGGILIIPALVLVGGLSIHEATATALFTFLFTGLLGTWLYHRTRSLDWRVTVPVCAGAGVCGYAGASIAAHIESRPLSMVVALLILASGTYILLPAASRQVLRREFRRQDRLVLAGVGAVSGVGSGLSGAGGPVFAVPLMIMLRYAPITAVATGQVLQVAASASGTARALRDGRVDFGLAAFITGFELLGVALGARVALAASPSVLRRLAAILCTATGVLFLMRLP